MYIYTQTVYVYRCSFCFHAITANTYFQLFILISGGIGSGRSAVSDFFESNWKENMTMNAAIKMGLEALRNSLDSELNREAVEIAIIDSSGYRTLDRDEVNKNIDKLKPLENDE